MVLLTTVNGCRLASRAEYDQEQMLKQQMQVLGCLGSTSTATTPELIDEDDVPASLM